MMGEKKTAKTVIEPIDVVESALEEIELLGQLAEEEGEELVLEDAERAIRIVEKGIEALDFRVMLGSPPGQVQRIRRNLCRSGRRGCL